MLAASFRGRELRRHARMRTMAALLGFLRGKDFSRRRASRRAPGHHTSSAFLACR